MPDNYFEERIKTKLQRLAIPFREADWELFQKQLEPPIDQLARAKLVDFEDENPESDWDQFYERFVDNTFSKISDYSLTTQPTTAFDKYIPDELDLELADTLDIPLKNALNNYEVDYENEDWETFSAQFHGAFDASIQHHLRNYEAAYNPAHWHNMTEQLNQPFYKAVKTKIVNYQVPFRKIDWWRMALRMSHRQLIESRPLQKIPSYAYGMAAAIALFFMLNMATLLERQPVLTPIAVNEGTEKLINDKKSELSSIESIDPNQIVQFGLNGSSLAKDASIQIAESAENIITQQAEQISNNKFFSTLDSIPNSTNKISVSPTAPTTSLMLASEESASSKSRSNIDEERDSDLVSTVAGINPVSKNLSSGMLDIIRAIPEIGDEKIRKLKSPSGQLNPEIKIGLIGGFNTSVAELTNRGRPGYHSGIRVEMVFDELWSVVSGISYTQKQYQHGYVSFETTQRRQRLVKADFKTVEIPLLVRHTFPQSGKLALYTQAGIVAMITMEESYFVYNPNSVANIGIPTPNLRTLAPQEQLLNFHTYIGNVHAAMGLEYEISDNIHLQIEPFFQLGFQKMGAPAKKLYSAGLNFGAVYKLGKEGP